MLITSLILLTLGWEDLPKAVSVHGTSPEQRLVEPTPGILVQIGDGSWILLDTGFNVSLIRDRALYRRFYSDPSYIPVLPEGDGEPILDALKEVGVRLDDISAVAVSHLHHDHAGGIKLFAGRVPIHVQRPELEYGLANHPEPESHAMARIDFDDPRIDWRLADGITEIAPGLTAIPTYGHTAGHQSFVVEFDPSVGGGGYVFAFDAADLTENIENESALGGYVGDDPQITVPPIRYLKGLAAERRFPLIPGHDPEVWPRLTDELRRRFPVGRARSATSHDLPGLWQRTLLVGTDGREDTTADVRWIQSGDFYVDLRTPAGGDGGNGISGPLGVEGFAGTLVFDGTETFEWRREIDVGPPSDSPDAGTLHFVESVLVETGIHENYVEHWVATRDSATPQAAARLHGDVGERAIVVRSGSYFGWAQSIPGLRTDIIMGEHRGGSWTITASSAPAHVGADVDLDAIDAGTGRSIEIATDCRRRWTIAFSEGEFGKN